jgi:hypothetical protein
MGRMPKRSGKGTKVTKLRRRARDVNQLASAVLRRTVELAEGPPLKDPAAVALGRRGGLKGGRSRMASLTSDERRKLALKGARARWGKKSSS